MTKSVGATSEAGHVRSASSQFRTHEFGFDPFERVRVGFRDSARFRRLPLFAAGAIVLALGGGSWLAFASADQGAASKSAPADRERTVAELDAEILRRSRQVSELDGHRAALESEIAATEKRLAAIGEKHAIALRELADLTAPVTPAQDEAAASRAEPDAASELFAPATADAASSSTAPSEIEPSDAARADPEPAAPVVAAQAAGAAATGSPVRVFIHVRSADRAALERARAVAEELRRRGVVVAEIRGVVRPVRRDAVRFFYDADRTAVTTLQDAVRSASAPGDSQPQSQDFRSYGAPPRPGTLELWLS